MEKCYCVGWIFIMFSFIIQEAVQIFKSLRNTRLFIFMNNLWIISDGICFFMTSFSDQILFTLQWKKYSFFMVRFNAIFCENKRKMKWRYFALNVCKGRKDSIGCKFNWVTIDISIKLSWKVFAINILVSVQVSL